MGRGSKRRCSDPLQKKHALHLAAIGGTVNIIRLTNHVDAACWDWQGNIDLAVLNRLVQVPRADEH